MIKMLIESRRKYTGVGALTKDLNRGLTIEYDNMNNPRFMRFDDGNTILYDYSSDGTLLSKTYGAHKLKAANAPSVGDNGEESKDTSSSITPPTPIYVGTTEYSGDIIYKDGKPDKVLFPGGYCTFAHETNEPQFHYFTQDHLGNNRAVISESGEAEQITHYYPFGGTFGDAGLNPALQQYKYNGKLLDRIAGLNTYDYGARQYYPLVPWWDRMDKMCEKYYNISPYAYCLDNPINRFDKNGNDSYLIIWASQSDAYGHASIGVDNYRRNPITNQIEKDGTISTIGLFPSENYRGMDAVYDRKVRGVFYLERKTNIDNIKNNHFNSNEKYEPDGILKFTTSYDEDETIRRNIKFEIDSNKGYRGRSRNCSTFVKDVLPDRIKKDIDGKESFLFVDYVTPNQLFQDAKKSSNTEMILDPEHKTEFKFKDRIIIK